MCYRPPRCTHTQYSYTAPHIRFLGKRGKTNVTKSNPSQVRHLPSPSMPYALYSPNRGRLCQPSASHKDTKGLTLSLKHWTGLSRKNCVRYQTALSQISIQVLYGRLTKVSRIIFLYLRANQGFQFATSHTLRV